VTKKSAPWRSLLRGLGARNRKTVVPASAGEPVIPEALRIGLYAKDVAHIVMLHQEGLAMLRALGEAQTQTQSLLGEVRDALNTQITTLRSLLQPAREICDHVNQLSQRTVEPADLVARLGHDVDRRVRSAVEIGIADILTCLTDSSARVERRVEAALARMDQQPQPHAAEGGTVRFAGGPGEQSEPDPMVQLEERVAGPPRSHGAPSPRTDETPNSPTSSRRLKASPPPLPPEAVSQLAAAITGIRADSASDPEGLLARLRTLQDSTSGPTPKLAASQWARDKIRQAVKAATSNPAKADSILAALLSRIDEHIQERPSPEELPDNAVPAAPPAPGQVTGGEGAAALVDSAAIAEESGLVIA
jgi:hypothetical protein